MSTKNQRIKNKNKFKYYKLKRPAFKGNPHKRGVVMRLRICTPRKPNSARRPTAKVVLSNKRRITPHIPGSGHNLRRHSKVLVFGTGARDLPNCNYSCVRGVYDFSGLLNKKKRRSIYGVQRDTSNVSHIRRKFRK